MAPGAAKMARPTSISSAVSSANAQRDADREANAVFAKLKSMTGPESSEEDDDHH